MKLAEGISPHVPDGTSSELSPWVVDVELFRLDSSFPGPDTFIRPRVIREFPDNLGS